MVPRGPPTSPAPKFGAGLFVTIFRTNFDLKNLSIIHARAHILEKIKIVYSS